MGKVKDKKYFKL